MNVRKIEQEYVPHMKMQTILIRVDKPISQQYVHHSTLKTVNSYTEKYSRNPLLDSQTQRSQLVRKPNKPTKQYEQANKKRVYLPSELQKNNRKQKFWQSDIFFRDVNSKENQMGKKQKAKKVQIKNILEYDNGPNYRFQVFADLQCLPQKCNNMHPPKNAYQFTKTYNLKKTSFQ